MQDTETETKRKVVITLTVTDRPNLREHVLGAVEKAFPKALDTEVRFGYKKEGDDDVYIYFSKDDVENAGESFARQEYYDDVKSTAESILDEYKDNLDADELPDRDAENFNEMLHENVDGSSWIIYDSKAADVLKYSDNDNAFDREHGGEGTTNVRAFYAMEADVRDELMDLFDAATDDCADCTERDFKSRMTDFDGDMCCVRCTAERNERAEAEAEQPDDHEEGRDPVDTHDSGYEVAKDLADDRG